MISPSKKGPWNHSSQLHRSNAIQLRPLRKTQSGRRDQMTLNGFSAPRWFGSHMEEPDVPTKESASFKNISFPFFFFPPLLICELKALRISINRPWVQHGNFISQEFVLSTTFSLGLSWGNFPKITMASQPPGLCSDLVTQYSCTEQRQSLSAHLKH